MNRHYSRIGALAGVLLLLVQVGTTYALSTGYHTVSGIRHGCPSDPGCVGTEDNIRHGYSRAIDGTPRMSGATVSIHRASDRSRVAKQTCSYCRRLDVKKTLQSMDRECKYVTFHYVSGRLAGDPMMPVAAGWC